MCAPRPLACRRRGASSLTVWKGRGAHRLSASLAVVPPPRGPRRELAVWGQSVTPRWRGRYTQKGGTRPDMVMPAGAWDAGGHLAAHGAATSTLRRSLLLGHA